MKIFLGGTCAENDWRGKLIPLLDAEIEYFNPVVSDWSKECQEREISEREKADTLLYVITPQMKGLYSIAEVIDDVNRKPKSVIFAVLTRKDSQSGSQMRSLDMVGKMVKDHGGTYLPSPLEIEDLAKHLNNRNKRKEKTASTETSPFFDRGFRSTINRFLGDKRNGL